MRRLLTFSFWRWPLAGVLALLLLAVLVLWVANRHDDALLPEAAEALRFEPPDAQAMRRNGYFVLLGLGAPAGEDSQQVGEQVFLRDLERYRHRFEVGQDWSDYSPSVLPMGSLKDLRCPDGADCLAHYTARPQAVQEALHTYAQVLSRYWQASDTPAYEEVPIPYPGAQLPRYHSLTITSELAGMQAAMLLQAGQFREALALMQRNTHMHQRLLSGSRTLLSAMVTLVMVYQHQRLLSDMARAHPGLVADAPEPWLAALGNWPLSLVPAVEGEIRSFTALGTGLIQESPPFTPPFRGSWATLGEEWLTNAMVQLAYLPHQTANLLWGHWEGMRSLALLPPQELAAKAAEAERRAAQHVIPSPLVPRNLFGRLVLGATGRPISAEGLLYLQRAHDLEGHRRLVRLQLAAYRQGIAPAEMAAWLQRRTEDLRSPYTQEPMLWDSDRQSLVFHGREIQLRNLEPRRTYHVRLH